MSQPPNCSAETYRPCRGLCRFRPAAGQPAIVTCTITRENYCFGEGETALSELRHTRRWYATSVERGDSIQEIVESVQRVSNIIAEITGATGEQSIGIGEVNQAAAQLDEVTQQNAALVEESSAAADFLKEQSFKLAEVVGRFHLTENVPLL